MYFRSAASSANEVGRARQVSRRREEDAAREERHGDKSAGTTVRDASITIGYIQNANSSHTGMTGSTPSPNSSDFETISDSELALLRGTAPPFSASTTTTTHVPPIPARSSTRSTPSRGRSRSRGHVVDLTSEYTPPPPPPLLPPPTVPATSTRFGTRSAAIFNSLESGSAEADGDDEFSAVEDDEGRGRGRGRTRRREDDPAMRKSMLEDALRSSLATLLSLSAPHQSLSPAMSSANLSTLVTAGVSSPLRSSAFNRPSTRMSPFAFALTEDESPAEVTADAQPPFFDDDQELSEEAIEFYSEDGGARASSSSDDDGTQLATRTQAPAPSSARSSRAIPITASGSRSSGTRGRSHSDSLPEPPAFSPIQSRPLKLGPSSASPPVWSRRRTRPLRRGQRRSSNSPPPAGVEERRRARHRGATDAESSGVEPDRTFFELVDAAKGFQDMAPRLSGSSPTVTASTSASRSASATVPDNAAVQSSSLFASAPAPTLSSSLKGSAVAFHTTRSRLDTWSDAPSSPGESLPSSDPALASSVPTLELSSEADEVVSGPANSGAKGSSREAENKAKREVAELEEAAASGEGDRASAGWFAWLGKTVELKTWQLLGLCGFLIGVGVGVGVGVVGSTQSSSLLKHAMKGSQRFTLAV